MYSFGTVKTGEIDPNLWIPLEDIHDGWEQSGEVGQEVYGAGIAFGVVPRQYIKVPGNDFMLYTDYPVSALRFSGKNSLIFKTGGDSQLNCTLIVLASNTISLKDFSLSTALRGRPKTPLNQEIQVQEKSNSASKAASSSDCSGKAGHISCRCGRICIWITSVRGGWARQKSTP